MTRKDVAQKTLGKTTQTDIPIHMLEAHIHMHTHTITSYRKSNAAYTYTQNSSSLTPSSPSHPNAFSRLYTTRLYSVYTHSRSSASGLLPPFHYCCDGWTSDDIGQFHIWGCQPRCTDKKLSTTKPPFLPNTRSLTSTTTPVSP